MLQPDYKIFEMNKRLQQRTEDSDNLWWDAFANEFFEDEAQLTLTFCLEDGPKRYSESTWRYIHSTRFIQKHGRHRKMLRNNCNIISKCDILAVGRTLIPRFFRSIFEVNTEL